VHRNLEPDVLTFCEIAGSNFRYKQAFAFRCKNCPDTRTDSSSYICTIMHTRDEMLEGNFGALDFFFFFGKLS